MIEVEKKFVITPEQEALLIEGATFIGEKKFTDTYYDHLDHRMTISDLWLRKRDDNFELKVPLNKQGVERISDQYHELETEKEVAAFLKLSIETNFEDSLKQNTILPFCTITTTRKKYKKGGFGIDIDEMDFGYHICEIELMVNDVAEIPMAEEKILAFAQKCSLPTVRVRGKVLEYLRLNNLAHMEAIEANLGTSE